MRPSMPLARALAISLALSLGPPLLAQKFGKLPGWAESHARAASTLPAPEEADAWVLLDRTEVAYTGGGDIRLTHFTLVKVLTERGLGEAWFHVHTLGGKGNRIKKLKGWNIRPDGEVTRIDKDDAVTFDADAPDVLTTELQTLVALDRVMKGSYIAFESQELLHRPMGPAWSMRLMREHPVRRLEVAVLSSVAWYSSSADGTAIMEARHMQPWFPQVAEGVIPPQLVLTDLPALPRDEGGTPPEMEALPHLYVRFTNLKLPDAPSLEGWDPLAQWFERTYQALADPVHPVDVKGMAPGAALAACHAWMNRDLTYKQVYLSPARGWIPEVPREVLRKRFGDCKDLATTFMACAKDLGFEACPALALMGAGRVEAGDPVTPYAFNHVIAAIRLKASLGLASEVETSQGRFLLVDATARTTPLGQLPRSHRLGRLLVCTPKGALWVEVPEAALMPGTLKVRLEGALSPAGRLKGTLVVTDPAYRTLALEGGAKAVKEDLASFLDLPPDAPWDMTLVGDPLDLDHPFEVKVAFEHPKALARVGSDLVLASLALPASPRLIQKSGKPRQFPVFQRGGRTWDWEARIELAEGLAPVLPDKLLDTPFRTVTWSARAEGRTLLLRYRRVTKDVDFPYARREEGVQQQRQDRSQTRLLMEEALSLRPGP